MQSPQLYANKLFKQFSQCYCPLLLPKIAKYCYNLSASPILTRFVTKLKLYDIQTTKRENQIVRIVQFRTRIKSAKHHFSQTRLQNNNSKHHSTQINLNFTVQTLSKKSSHADEGMIQINEKSQNKNQKQKWKMLLLTYNQLYEYIRIMSCRIKDLEEFASILKQSQIFSLHLEQTKEAMKRYLAKANAQLKQMFWIEGHYLNKQNHEYGRNFLRQDKSKRNILDFKPFINSRKLTTQQSKRQIINHNRLKTQNQASPQHGKSAFLKQKPKIFFKPQKQTNKKQIPEISKNPFTKRKTHKRQKSYTNRAQISFKANRNDDKKSSNTQENFFEELEDEMDEIVFQNSKPRRETFRSQKEIIEKPMFKENKITTWHVIEQQPVNRLLKPSIFKHRQKTSLVQSRPSISPIKSTIDPTTCQGQSPKATNISTQRISNLVQSPSHQKKLSNDRLSQQMSSRTSITSNSRNSLLNGKGVYGMRRNNKSKIQDAETFGDVIIKYNSKKVEKRKVRFGALKKDLIEFNDQDSKTISIRDSILEHDQKGQKGKNRRNGKKLPQQMNNRFQRIIQDQAISKMIQTNQERQNMLKETRQSPENKKYQGKLRRINRNQNTESSLGSTTLNGIQQNSQFSTEQYYKSILYPNKQMSPTFNESNALTTNYSDLLALQKNLKPISTYNEAKMFTRYSLLDKNRQDLGNFQFKYQNGKLMFNHEFYLRTQQENNQSNVQERIQRNKQSKIQYQKLQFMKRFTKCIDRIDDPIQVGYDDLRYQKTMDSFDNLAIDDFQYLNV